MRCKQCRWGNNQDMTAYYNFNNTRKLIHFEMNTMQETESLQSLEKIFSHSTLCRNDFLVTQFCKLTNGGLKITGQAWQRIGADLISFVLI